MDKDAKIRLLDKIKAEWNLPTEADGINVARALELQCMLLFRGWCYRLKEEHFTGKTITRAISNRPPEVHKDKWDWLVNHWADPKQQVFHDHSSSKGLHEVKAKDKTSKRREVNCQNLS